MILLGEADRVPAEQAQPAGLADPLAGARHASRCRPCPGASPSRPSSTALSVPWPMPVGAERAEQLGPDRADPIEQAVGLEPHGRKTSAARIGPTVCELDGPMPILNRSNDADRHQATSRSASGCSRAAIIHRKAPAEPRDLLADLRDHALIAQMVEHITDPAGDQVRLGLAKTARGDRGGADPQAAGHEGRLRVVRHARSC